MGKFAEAKTYHRRATRRGDGDRDEAYLNLGLIARAEREYRKAQGYFDRAIKIDPNYWQAKEAREDVVRAMKLVRRRKSKSGRTRYNHERSRFDSNK